MFGKIATFELRYQLRNPVFWVVAILFFLLTFGAMTVQQIQIGGGGNIHKNAPVAIARIHMVLSLFFMFVTTAFVANVIVRDDESGFGPMVRSTRVSRFDYLIARFLGAFLAVAIAYLVVPLGMWLGSLMPWVDPETVGPNHIGHYAFAYLVVALPNLFLTSALFFAVATMTRSMTYSYLSVIVLLAVWGIATSWVRSKPELRETIGYLEPFGAAALSDITRYWTAAESNTRAPTMTQALVTNRVLWFGIALAAVAVAYSRFTFSDRGVSKRRLRKQARQAARLAADPPTIVGTLPAPRTAAAVWPRFRARCAFEMRLVFRSPAFLILLLIGLANAVSALLFTGQVYGTPTRPLTFIVIDTLQGAFSIIPVIVAIYYSGELVWRDRERKMHEIIDATALPNWAYMLPKTLAVAGVLFATIAISMVAAMLVQLTRGQTQLELGQYIGWYLLPQGVDMVILAVLAVFVQSISPNKYIGWGIMTIYLVATITLTNIGFEHPLYTYGTTGTARLSDMNGSQIGGPVGWWLRLYWGAFAVVLATLAHLLWRRGTETRLMPRLRHLPRRMTGRPGAILAAALAVFAVTGGWLFWNMNVRNTYRTQDDRDARLAAYEKKYLRYETLRQPSLTDIAMTVDLYPGERRALTRGTYRFVNDTGAPLRDLHVRLPNDLSRLRDVRIPGARLVSDDADNQYRIYRFDAPMAPGATGSLRFVTERQQRGLRANGDDTNLVANGTFLNNFALLPQIGMDRFGLLSDPLKRREYGLTPQLRLPKLEDMAATRRNYIANAAWVRSDITVSTDAGQIPIAPGRKVADGTAGGRRTARFVAEAPILAFFSVQSADYVERMADAGGVRASVFYDRKHGYNVDRMLTAVRNSLAYYRTAFGPYQFDYARIVEFPGYESFAQAFAGTIPYSERLGFVADARKADAIDYIGYVTAHEMAHQYWGHQLVGAEMQGGTMLVETMAQYGALMVMKRVHGEDKIRRFLRYELDSYLSSRGGERIEELPLNRVENQPYIHYRKGSLVVYLLQDRLGEDRVNAMLRGVLARYRFKGAPYARSTDLVDGYLSLARTPAERELVLDLLTRITIYDLKATGATTRRLPDGRFETVVDIDAAKFYADGKGTERQAPLADTINVGLFDARPGFGAFAAKDVVWMERRPIVSRRQQVRIVTTRRPAFAGVDPYNFYIDRNSDDNIVPVG